MRALREMPDELRGWQTENAARCNAGAAKLSRCSIPTRVGQRCEFCGSPELVDYEEIKSPIRPQSLLPFKVAESTVRDRSAAGTRASGSRQEPEIRALVDTVKGVYIPYWTFDAQVVCPWEGEAGHYYYTTETYRDNKGRTQTRQVQHVRWEPASGVLEHFFDDEPIPGTRGVSLALLRQVEPFMTNELVPYATSYLSGFVVEHYQVVLLDAAKASEDSMVQKLESSAQRRCLAIRTATWSSIRRFRRGRSSTSSSRSGC